MTLWRASAALLAFGLALLLAPHLQRPAAPNELPGAMQAKHLDPSGPIEEFAFIVALTFLGAALPLLLAKLRGVSVVAGASPASLPPPENQRARRPQPHEAILVGALLPLYFAFLDLFTLDPRWLFAAAVVLVIALRLLANLECGGHAAALRRPRAAAWPPHSRFALAPLALILQIGWLQPRPAAIAAIAWIVVTPFALKRLDLRRAIPWVCAIFAFAYPLALLGVSSPPALDFFEDGHELVTAGEMARGEHPYADIVPVHGFLSDGGIDWIAMKSGAESAGAILKTKRVVSALNLVAIYAVVLGATGSAELGLLAGLLAVALIPSATIWVRTIPALFALAATAAAVRLRSSRWIFAAGALTSIAFVFGMDFAVYSGIAGLVVAFRMRAARAFLTGVAAGAVPVLVIFLASGSSRRCCAPRYSSCCRPDAFTFPDRCSSRPTACRWSCGSARWSSPRQRCDDRSIAPTQPGPSPSGRFSPAFPTRSAGTRTRTL